MRPHVDITQELTSEDDLLCPIGAKSATDFLPCRSQKSRQRESWSLAANISLGGCVSWVDIFEKIPWVIKSSKSRSKWLPFWDTPCVSEKNFNWRALWQSKYNGVSKMAFGRYLPPLKSLEKETMQAAVLLWDHVMAIWDGGQETAWTLIRPLLGRCAEVGHDLFGGKWCHSLCTPQKSWHWLLFFVQMGSVRCLEEGVKRNFKPSQMERRRKNVESYKREVRDKWKFKKRLSSHFAFSRYWRWTSGFISLPKRKPVIWPQRPRYFAAAIAALRGGHVSGWHIMGGGTILWGWHTLVGWLWSLLGWWPRGGGGKPEVSLLAKRLELQYYFAPCHGTNRPKTRTQKIECSVRCLTSAYNLQTVERNKCSRHESSASAKR